MQGNYGDVQRALLQQMMIRRFVEEQELINSIRSLINRFPSEKVEPPNDGMKLMEFFNNMNKEIGPDGINFGEIVRIKAENDPNVFWGLRSVKSVIDDDSKDNENLEESLYSEPELSLFKLIIEELVTNPMDKGCIDHNKAINLGLKLKPKRLDGKESSNLIDRLVEEDWLAKFEDQDGKVGRHTTIRITFGIRSLLDLKNYITATWPEEDLRCCTWENDWLFRWRTENRNQRQLLQDTDQMDPE